MIIFILIFLFVNCNAKGGRNECGPHGNFEYCIEGFPGCVVGCHCFPGYYFDTDTKICEPNMKLTQDFRRQYATGTRSPPGANDAPTVSPPPTTAHALEAHVDEIAKDTGDLSDWLYNQFFKTIENQVINKTDDDELLKGSRRSGGGAARKSKRHGNKKKHLKKSTKRGLRRKLLRISEDDSMFDSSSDSESRSSSDSGTWESWEEDMGSQTGHHGDGDDKDHGHRKIVVYNKQPKAPLPSFIFLPNVETPFYPPIGLPVPPMPMYPMIPVPPIIPPPVCVDNSTGNETTTTTKATTTTAATTEPPQSTQTETETPTTAENTSINPVENSTEPGLRKALRSQHRKKLLQRLKDKNNQQQIIKRMGTMSERLQKSKNNHFIDQLQDPLMFAPENLYQEPIMEETHIPEKDDVAPYENDVDFKYLTQLIHRVDPHQPTSLPTIQFTPNRTISVKDMRARAMYRKLNRPPITPGRLQAGVPTRRRFEDCSSKPDDTYYSNLGRQIATLIRGINPNVVGEVDIDIDRTNRKSEPFLSENSFAPRSYWERFVRSPLRIDLGHFSSSKDENLKESNEQLFDLENKVKVAASSPSVLTLQELENAISAMNKVQMQVQSRQFNQDNFKLSNSSLNVSLLPGSRSKPTAVPKKLTNEIIMDTLFNVETGRVNNKKGVLCRNSRRNIPSTNSAKADRTQSNFTNDNQLFKEYKHTELFSKMPSDKFSFTSQPASLKSLTKTIRSPNSKYQPSHSNVNNYFSYNKNHFHNFRSVAKAPHAYYIKPKPTSYFFNEFDFFVRKK